MCAFSTSLTTTVFSQRSMWRFETVPHRTIPEGQQSSIFHRALIPPSDCLPTTRFLIRGAPEVECTRERASKRWVVLRHAEHPRDSRLRDWTRHTCRMAGGSPQPASREWFTTPHEVNHRRYEALRAFFVEGLTHAAAGERFGYTRWAMVNLVREHRAGRTELFAPARKPGPAPGSAPAKDRARARVIELRRAGLSTYEISARLPGEGTPLNRTSVAEILAEEGFGRLLRRPEPAESTSPATPGRDTRLPRTARLDFATWPATVETGKAGLHRGGPGGEVQPGGPGQAGVASGGGRRGALGRLGTAQQPPESFLGEDLGHAGAVQRRSLAGQAGGDLIGGQPGEGTPLNRTSVAEILAEE